MTLKQLEAFYWAATCANFAIAAQRVNVSISSLSKRITELEQSLGVVLFDRSGHRAVLNQDGQALMPRALALLEKAAAIREPFAPVTGLVGQCRFGVGELSALTWLPQFMAAARTQHPGLLLQPHVDVGAALEQQLDDGELDFAIIAGRSSRQSLVAYPIAQAGFVWTTAHALCPAGTTVADLLRQGQPIIALPATAGTTRLIDDWLLANRIAHVEKICCNNWGAIAGMLAAGLGVGILPQAWADALAMQQVLARPRNSKRLAPLVYCFHWRRGDTRALQDQMRTLASTMADFSASIQLPPARAGG